MEWDIKRVYSAVNADEVKVGSKVISAFSVNDLRLRVEEPEGNIMEVLEIYNTGVVDRFLCTFHGESMSYPLCYLISEPEEKVLKWTDLKIGDVVHKDTLHCMVQSIDCNPSETSHIAFDNRWVTDIELSQWEKVE